MNVFGEAFQLSDMLCFNPNHSDRRKVIIHLAIMVITGYFLFITGQIE